MAQSTHNAYDIGQLDSILDNIFDSTNDNKEVRANKGKADNVDNDKNISQDRTITSPEIKKRRSSSIEENKYDKVSKFIYDDMDDDENVSKSNLEGNEDIVQEDFTNLFQNTRRVNKASKGDIPDLVIDQVVYEESDTNILSLKKSVLQLEEKIKGRDEKDKENFKRLFVQMGRLYRDLQEIKKAQDEFSKKSKEMESMKTDLENLINRTVPPSYRVSVNPTGTFSVPHIKHTVINYVPSDVPRVGSVLMPPKFHITSPVVMPNRKIIPSVQVPTRIIKNHRIVSYLPVSYRLY